MAYQRPLAQTMSFVNVKNNHRAFYAIKADLHNRRITVTYGRIGTQGVQKVLVFKTRDDARDYLEMILERREMIGYQQVA